MSQEKIHRNLKKLFIHGALVGGILVLLASMIDTVDARNRGEFRRAQNQKVREATERGIARAEQRKGQIRQGRREARQNMRHQRMERRQNRRERWAERREHRQERRQDVREVRRQAREERRGQVPDDIQFEDDGNQEKRMAAKRLKNAVRTGSMTPEEARSIWNRKFGQTN